MAATESRGGFKLMASADADDLKQVERSLSLCRRSPLVSVQAPWKQVERPLSLCRRFPLVSDQAPWQSYTSLSSRCAERQVWIPEWRYRQWIVATLGGGVLRAIAPFAEIGTDLITSEIVQYSAEIVSGGASRVVAPFLELGRDALDCCEIFRRRTSMILEGHFTRSYNISSDLIKRLAEQPLIQAFEELIEDSGLRTGNAVMLGLLLAAPHPASGALLLCGFQTATAKAILMGSAATLGIGSYFLFNRFEHEPDRLVQNRSALACGAVGAAYLALAYLGGVPPEIADFFSFPELVVHYAADLIVNPLMLSNLGYLSGCTTSSMFFTLLFNELSTASFIGSTLSQFNPTQSSLLLCMGVGFMGLCGYTMNKLPELAYAVGPVNRQRVKISSDMLLFSMTLFPLIHGLCIPQVMGLEEAVEAFALLDVITKLGMCHISLKSERVLKNAENVFKNANANLGANRQ